MAQELDLHRYREMLEKEQQRMLRQIRTIDSGQDRDMSETLSELSDYDDHPRRHRHGDLRTRERTVPCARTRETIEARGRGAAEDGERNLRAVRYLRPADSGGPPRCGSPTRRSA